MLRDFIKCATVSARYEYFNRVVSFLSDNEIDTIMDIVGVDSNLKNLGRIEKIVAVNNELKSKACA